MKEIELDRNELMQIDGGDWKETAFKVVWTAYKYSSVTGALVTGIIEGYYEEKAKQK